MLMLYLFISLATCAAFPLWYRVWMFQVPILVLALDVRRLVGKQASQRLSLARVMGHSEETSSRPGRKRNRSSQKEEETETHGKDDTLQRKVEFNSEEEKKRNRILKKVGFNDLSEAVLQFRMKILLVFTLCLISGPVSCFDVIGYSGGSVIIYCRDKQYGVFTKYFCKETPKQCVNDRYHNQWRHIDRFSLHDSSEYLTVIYRNLNLQDAGSYQCAESGVWSHDMNLKVKTDPCCLRPNTVAGYLGETVTIRCSYPEEFERNTKYLFKQDGPYFTQVNRPSESQRGRFSISDDRRSKVLRVRISDVREDDGGVYYCGVWSGGGQSVSYYSLHTETQLQVTGETHFSGCSELQLMCVERSEPQ
ncbi:hypothetical protein MHYP_G00104490 [Metynnis hypsauchen]